MPPPDLIDLFVAPFNAIGIEYMVSGAVAATMYGEPRLTNDIDLVVSISAVGAAQLTHAFEGPEFYVPPVEVVEAERTRPRDGHFNIIHFATALKADVYHAGTDPFIAWGLKHRRKLVTSRHAIWTAPPEYVIVFKLQYWHDGGSAKHFADIRSMLRVLGESVDRTLISSEADRRGLRDKWEAVRSTGVR